MQNNNVAIPQNTDATQPVSTPTPASNPAAGPSINNGFSGEYDGSYDTPNTAPTLVDKVNRPLSGIDAAQTAFSAMTTSSGAVKWYEYARHEAFNYLDPKYAKQDEQQQQDKIQYLKDRANFINSNSFAAGHIANFGLGVVSMASSPSMILGDGIVGAGLKLGAPAFEGITTALGSNIAGRTALRMGRGAAVGAVAGLGQMATTNLTSGITKETEDWAQYAENVGLWSLWDGGVGLFGEGFKALKGTEAYQKTSASVKATSAYKAATGLGERFIPFFTKNQETMATAEGTAGLNDSQIPATEVPSHAAVEIQQNNHTKATNEAIRAGIPTPDDIINDSTLQAKEAVTNKTNDINNEAEQFYQDEAQTPAQKAGAKAGLKALDSDWNTMPSPMQASILKRIHTQVELSPETSDAFKPLLEVAKKYDAPVGSFRHMKRVISQLKNVSTNAERHALLDNNEKWFDQNEEISRLKSVENPSAEVTNRLNSIEAMKDHAVKFNHSGPNWLEDLESHGRKPGDHPIAKYVSKIEQHGNDLRVAQHAIKDQDNYQATIRNATPDAVSSANKAIDQAISGTNQIADSVDTADPKHLLDESSPYREFPTKVKDLEADIKKFHVEHPNPDPETLELYKNYLTSKHMNEGDDKFIDTAGKCISMGLTDDDMKVPEKETYNYKTNTLPKYIESSLKGGSDAD